MQSKLKKLLGLVLTLFAGFGLQAQAQEVPNRTAAPTPGGDQSAIVERATRRAVLNNARAAAAARTKAALQAKGGKVDPKTLGVNPAGAAKVAALAPKGGTVEAGLAVPGLGFQLAQPDYLNGTASNWHYTNPLLRKFVDTLPGLGVDNKNNLGNYIPVGVADTGTYPGSDYYEIDLVEYTQQLHSGLAPTKLRGYVQHSSTPWVNGHAATNYLGPVIIAHKDRPVRVKFTNLLPTGARDVTTGRRPGDLFIPWTPPSWAPASASTAAPRPSPRTAPSSTSTVASTPGSVTAPPTSGSPPRARPPATRRVPLSRTCPT